MSNSARYLGVLAMAGSPFLGVETHLYSQAGMHNTSLTGLCDLLFMTGWAAGVLGLLRRQATGRGRAGRAILQGQLGLLALACVGNAWIIVDPAPESPLYRPLDWCWPVSNCFMLVTAAGVLAAGRLSGWPRYVPLLVAGWLPTTALLGTAFGNSPITYYGMNGYSLLAWLGMGVATYCGWRRPVPAPAPAPQLVPAAS